MNQSKPFFTVIINCFNCSKFLEEAIHSVLDQSFEDWELILWDNCSKDSSESIFNTFEDVRFRYYKSDEHTNLAMARNAAIKRARGQWVGFLDSDDLWMPTKLERQLELININEPKLGLVYGYCKTIVSQEESKMDNYWTSSILKHRFRKKNKLREGKIFSSLINENFIPLSSAVFPRKVFQEVGGIDENLIQAEDYDLFLKISNKYKVRAVNDVITKYRLHGENLSINQTKENFVESISILSKYLPSKKVQKAISYHNTSYGIYEIKNRKFIKGIMRIILKGSFIKILKKLCSSI